MTLGPTFGRFCALVIQSNGDVVAAGASGSSFDSRQCAIARFTPTSSLDTSFGTKGVTLSSLGTFNSGIWRMAIQSDGKFVGGGMATSGGVTRFLVTRYSN